MALNPVARFKQYEKQTAAARYITVNYENKPRRKSIFTCQNRRLIYLCF